MKAIICVFFVIVIITAHSFSQTLNVQEENTDNFENMTFEVTLNKNHYLLGEPIFIKFQFSNRTGVAQKTYEPAFMQEAKLRSNFKGKNTQYEHLSSVIGKPFRLPGLFKPDALLVNDEVLSPAFVTVFFPEPGVYHIQFVLQNSAGNRSIKSNSVDITFENPAGLDKAAFDFMTKHRDFFGSSSWGNGDDKDLELLQQFVIQFGQSVYGELAISSLGSLYLSSGAFDNAKYEFQKLKGSKNPLFANQAEQSLADIQKRIDAQQNNEKPQPE